MTIATYADLTAAVRDWLGRTNDSVALTDARVADAVRLAEVDIYERLRVREMETSGDLTINAQTVAIPTGMIGVRRLYITSDPLLELEYMAPPQFWGSFGANITGQPWAYTMEGDNFVFGPSPSATYTGKLLYWKRLAALSSAVNSLFSNQPDLWLYGALSHAAVFTRDMEDAALWKGKFAEAMARAEMSNEKSRFGGAPLVMRGG